MRSMRVPPFLARLFAREVGILTCPGIQSIPMSALIARHTIDSPDGVTLSVQEWGNPAGPAILFIHGISQCHLSWRKQYESDLATQFRLVTFDLRGHGDSSKPLDAPSYQENPRWAHDLNAIMDTLNLDRPVLVGWCLRWPRHLRLSFDLRRCPPRRHQFCRRLDEVFSRVHFRWRQSSSPRANDRRSRKQ